MCCSAGNGVELYYFRGGSCSQGSYFSFEETLSPKPPYFFYEEISSKRPVYALHHTARRWLIVQRKISISVPLIVQMRNAKKNRKQHITRRMVMKQVNNILVKKLAKDRKTCNRNFSKHVKAGSQPESQSG